MKPASARKSLRAALALSLLSLFACAALGLYSIAAAHPPGNPGSALFPTALSLFPIVGLVAAVGFTQLLKRRRLVQLKAVGPDHG